MKKIDLKKEGAPLRVAILLATYNGISFIEKQIETLFSQNNVDVTVIASDDGSGDGTLQFLQAINNSKFCLLPLKISGSAAGNFYRLIKDYDPNGFDYVALSDQDDIWLPDKIFRAITAMSDNECEAYSSNLTAFDSSTNENWAIKKNYNQKKLDYIFQGASAGCTYVLSARLALYIRDKLLALPSESINASSHDWLIYALARSGNFGWYFDAASHILYRQHRNNVYGASLGFRGFIGRLKLALSGWYKNNIIFILFLVNSSDYEKRVYSALLSNKIFDKFWLLTQVRNFRRKPLDQLCLVFFILFGIL